jgi:S-adenosyl-L-methionine hydrolase (adenosine-forming)
LIITLLTDFGTRDHFVAAMKGVILARAPAARLVDISHDVPPRDVATAAFLLLAAYRDFPHGTVHLAVVDPGVGSGRKPLVLSAAGHFLVGPDNGIFSRVMEREEGWEAREISGVTPPRDRVSATFHGRDVFAPAASALARGVPPEQLGPPVPRPVQLEPTRPRRGARGSICGRVLHVDHFGNIISSFTEQDFTGGDAREYRFRIGASEIGELRPFYGSGSATSPFAIWGSAGFLEFALRDGSAAEMLRVAPGAAVEARPRPAAER